MFASLRARLWLSYLLVIGIFAALVVLALAVYLLRSPAVDRREITRLRTISTLVAQRRPVFNLEILEPGAQRLEDAARRLDNTLSVRIALFDQDGQLLVDSRQGRVAGLPSLENLRQERRLTPNRFTDSNGQVWLYVLTPLDGGNVVLAAAPRPRLPAIEILRDEFLPPLLRGLALALLLSLLMAFWITRWISAPLQSLTDGARAVSQGKFQQIPLQGPKEVQEVARSFNEMVTQVNTSRRAQRDLVANVSHDLKTPLTSIQGFAQALLDGTVSEGDDTRQSAQIIYDEAGRMHRLVLDLLDLARMDTGTRDFERVPIDLNRLLQAVAQKFLLQAQGGQVTLFYYNTMPDDMLPIIGDADRLAQVFANLVDNAIKFTPADGLVLICAERRAEWADVAIADSGSGVPAEELERIFERFYQTDKARSPGRRGAGLGLAIAREIIQAHGGEIHAEASIGKTFEELFGWTGEKKSLAAGIVFRTRLPGSQPHNENFTAPTSALTPMILPTGEPRSNSKEES